MLLEGKRRPGEVEVPGYFCETEQNVEEREFC